MAPPSPGWLIPPGDSPTRRALELLGTFLDEEQKQQAHRWDGFAHADGARVYWIRIDGGAPRCARLDMEIVINYCVAPRERRSVQEAMPGPDIALTHLLWIRHDAKGFLKEANALGSWSIPEGLSSDQLFELLARAEGSMADGSRVRGPAYGPFTRQPLITPRQREVGLTRARDLRTRLQVDELRDFFARNRVEVSDEMLRKLVTTPR